MTRLKDFSLRFSILRPAYKISTRTLAAILGIKTSGNITMVEKGQCFFSMDMIYKITELFAIEATWLMRHSNVPYTEHSMPRFEQLIRDIPITKDKRFIEYAPEYYSNYEKRVRYFSLQDRANIVFLVHYYNSIISQYPCLMVDSSSLKSKLTLVWDKIKDTVEARSSSFRFQDPLKEVTYIRQSLSYILFNPDRTCIGPDGKMSQSSIYIPPLYKVYDFIDGEELRNEWYHRTGDK